MRGLLLLSGTLLFTLVGCGDEDPLDRPADPSGGQGGSTGGSPTGGMSEGGMGGGPTGGTGGVADLCGNGELDPGEECDGSALGSSSCIDLGFEFGTPSCTSGCAYDTSTCFETEVCTDNFDNDGDMALDCADDECAAICADACLSPTLLPDGTTVSGLLDGHSSTLTASCANPDGDGVEIVYAYTATTTGMVDVLLDSDEDLTVSLRTSCADPFDETACENSAGIGVEFMSVPVAQGDDLFIVVEGFEAFNDGAFTLTASSRPIVCGDGFTDPGEGCDDGNTQPGDGCNGLCILESSETEPNDDPLAADPFADPFVGAVNPAGDVDYMVVTVPQAPGIISAQTVDFDGGCAAFSADSYLEVLTLDGQTVLASDDDSGEGYCSQLSVGKLDAGDYLVKITSSPYDAQATFNYVLQVDVTLEECGDGLVTPSEQCDDGGLQTGDGCDDACQWELDETEPNNMSSEADAYTSPWLAAIDSSSGLDEDWVSIAVPNNKKLSVQVVDAGDGTCAAGTLDSFIEVRSPSGGSVIASDDDGGVGYCSYLQTQNLSVGTYYVRVLAAPLTPNASFVYGLDIQLN